jgi:hypothetical protein
VPLQVGEPRSRQRVASQGQGIYKASPSAVVVLWFSVPMTEGFQWVPPGLSPSETTDFLALTDDIPITANGVLHRWLVEGKNFHEYIDWTYMLRFQSASKENLQLTVLNRLSVGKALEYF